MLFSDLAVFFNFERRRSKGWLLRSISSEKYLSPPPLLDISTGPTQVLSNVLVTLPPAVHHIIPDTMIEFLSIVLVRYF